MDQTSPRSTPRPVRRATMKQVAALAGVGTKTVSRVINREPNVSDDTAARVWDAIRALDYQVDMRAGSLRRSDGRTHSLGLLVSSVDNPFAGEVQRGVEDAARPRRVVVLASSLDEDPSREMEVVNDLLGRRVDGIIMDTTSTDLTYLGPTLGRGVPVVFIDRCPVGVNVDCVTSDNRDGAAAATRHLVERGHRRIALLTERSTIQTAAERRRGFLDELGRAGVPTGEATVITGLADAASAERALAGILASDRPPTAVFSTQNMITVGALHALQRLGLQHEIAFVAFDDVPLADLLDPGVTVIKQDPRAIGRTAAERMFRRLDGEQLPLDHVIVPTQLIERGSGEIPPRP